MSDGRGQPLAELMLPLGAIVFTSYYIVSVLDGPWEAKFSAYLVGFTLISLCLVFLTTRIWAMLRHRQALPRARWTIQQAIPDRGVLGRRLILLVLTFVYIALIENGGGFTLSNFGFLSLAILMLSSGTRPVRAVSVAALLSFCGYLVFIVAFDTRFPKGPFELTMERLFN